MLARVDQSKSNVVQTLILGDSVFMILRPNDQGELEKVFRSEEQRTIEGWKTSILSGKNQDKINNCEIEI